MQTTTVIHLTNGSRSEAVSLAFQDLYRGIGATNIWGMLAWQEIKQRYRRSVIGPLWLALSVGLLICAMGPLYGKLFGLDTSAYIPHLAISYVLWLLISTVLNECCYAFINAESLIKQIKMPLSIHVLKVIWKNFVVFIHQAIVILLVLLIFPQKITFTLILLPVGLILLLANALWVGILLGALSARFRDVPQIVASCVQMAFFLTPVLWQADTLGQYKWVINFNPLYHVLEVIRAPLLGISPFPWESLALNVGFVVVGFLITVQFYIRYRARIAYWV